MTDKFLTMLTTPCGQEITLTDGPEGRKYWMDGKIIWEPLKTHRTALMVCMTFEDGLRYQEKSQLIDDLAMECERLAEQYEPHPEIDGNSFDLGDLYVRVMQWKEAGNVKK